MSRRKKAPKKSHIGVVLDRSGSMSDIALETQQGFDQMIEKLREEADGATFVTLVQFDTDKETVYEQKPLADVPSLVLIPRGLTALRDGVGEAIRRMEKFVRPGDNVAITIMTDGGENSSSEYSDSNIKALMAAKEKDGWEFNFLGAGLNSWGGAAMLGIPQTHVINYAGAGVEQDVAFAAVAASNLSKMRGMSSSYVTTAPEIKAQLEADASLTSSSRDNSLGRLRGSGKRLK